MKTTGSVIKRLLSFLLATLLILGTTAFAAGGGMSFTCPETVHAGDTFTVDVGPMEGASYYSVHFWLDGKTDMPPISQISDKPGIFTLGPAEAGSYRVQVSALDGQRAQIFYTVIPVTVSDTEPTGAAMRWSSESSGYLYSSDGPASSGPEAPAAPAAATDDPLPGVWGIQGVMIPNAESGVVQTYWSAFFTFRQYAWITFFEDGTCQMIVVAGGAVNEQNSTWTRSGEQILLGNGAALTLSSDPEASSLSLRSGDGAVQIFSRRGPAPALPEEEKTDPIPAEKPLTGMDEVEGIWRAVAILPVDTDVLVPLRLLQLLGLPAEPTWIGALLCTGDQVFAMYDGGIVGGEATAGEGVVSTQAFENNPMLPLILHGTDCGWLSVTLRDGAVMYYERMSGVESFDLPLTFGQ